MGKGFVGSRHAWRATISRPSPQDASGRLSSFYCAASLLRPAQAADPKLSSKASGANMKVIKTHFPRSFSHRGESAMTTSLIRKAARMVAVLALVLTSTYSASAFAIAQIPGKGTCGFLLTMSYPFTYLHGSDPGDGWGLDALGTINFVTKTISFNITLIDPAPLPSVEAPFSFTTTFTLSPGPVPGSSTLTFSFPDNGGTFTFNLVAVNGGKTILMQGFNPNAGGQDGSIVGKCEM
jgi:hypothetical protein